MTELILPHTIDGGTEITAVEHQQNYEAIRDVINGELEGGSGSSGNFKANGVGGRELADALLQKGIPGPNLQEGVVAAGDLKVTPGAGLVLNFASGSAWVIDDSGLIATGALLPAAITGASVTIAANASGDPRIDQIILTLTGHNTGTVSVLQGTATAGATLDNRNGAAALPSNAIRLADILMSNAFAGPFVQATHIRDRRLWSRGGFKVIEFSGGDITKTGAAFTAIDATNLAPRIECNGIPVRIRLTSCMTVNAAQTTTFDVEQDTVALGQRQVHTLSAASALGFVDLIWDVTPAAGSHVFRPVWSAGASNTILRANANEKLRFVVEELIRQNSANDGA